LSFDDAISALSTDALKFVKDGYVLGLGSGRAATSFVKSLSLFIKTKKIKIKGVPTSLQIKLIAEQGKIPLIQADQVDHIDVVFDGADQIDSEKNLIKGGGGALLRENILINAAKKVVIMADKSKFVKHFNRSVPVEVHPLARSSVTKSIKKIGGKPRIRTLERGYPFITENGNIILDCNFGVIKKPKILAQKIIQIAGVMEVGIFTRKPDVIYKAKTNGKFEIIS
jgi:ribose 5-phosphate isomerase A